MILFIAEYFVFQFAIQKYKNYVIQKYNFCLLFCVGVKLLSLTLRGGHRLRVSENRVLGK